MTAGCRADAPKRGRNSRLASEKKRENRERRESLRMKREKFMFKMNKKGLTPSLYAHPNRFGFS